MKKMIAVILVTWFPFTRGSAQSGLTLPYADQLFQRGEYYRAISVYDQYLYFSAGNFGDSSYCELQIMKCYYLGQEYKNALTFGESFLFSRGAGDSIQREFARYAGLSYFKLGFPKSAMVYFKDTRNSSDFRLLHGICNLTLYEWDNANEQFTIAGRSSDSSASALGTALSKIALNGKNLSSRSPALAGVLSTLLPGAGYVYTGDYQTGAFSLVLNALLLGSAYELHRNNLKFSGTFIFLVGFGWYIGNIYGSYTSAVKYNESIRRDYVDESLKSFHHLLE